MIDVVFVIMLFFMVMAGAMKKEGMLTGRLPGLPANANVKTPDLVVVINVDEDGTISLNDEPFDAPTSKGMAALTATLQRLKAAADRQADKVLVSITAQPAARYERVVDALNALAKARIANITFGIAE